MRVHSGTFRPVAVAALVVMGPAASSLGQAPPLEFSFIPATDAQPGGPQYDFRISRFEVRNDQFVEFLNDALSNLDNPRGFFLYFDTDSGNVFIHGSQGGTAGADGSGTFLFSAADNPYVSYDGTAGKYEITASFEDHPVTGVSWYGAVKFCNWLTIATGLSPEDRAYAESGAANLNGWHPITTTDDAWGDGDLSDTQRDELLLKLGYRLPMDGGDGSGAPNAYHEWYKAAAWDSDAGANHLYGFGRDEIENADANYNGSGDPFEPGTTPVGYYNGQLDEGFETRRDENAYGLFDMSGNVWEWMQDQGALEDDRRSRGGSFKSDVISLRVTPGVPQLAGSANESTGFRVVQSVPTTLLVTPDTELVAEGPWGGPYDPELPQVTYRLANLTDGDVNYSVFSDANWVAVDGEASGALGGDESIDVVVSVEPTCDGQVGAGTHVATVTFLNQDDGARIERAVTLVVTESLTLAPNEPFSATILFGDIPPSKTYTLANGSETTLEWSVRATNASNPNEQANWVTFNDVPGVTGGDIGPVPDTLDVTVGFDTGGLGAGTYGAVATFVDECTSAAFLRSMILTIDATFQVTPTCDVISTGVEGGPFTPSSHSFTIKNVTADPVAWSVTLEPVDPETQTGWLAVDPSEGTLSESGEATEVTAAIQAAASLEQVGQHAIRLVFGQPSTGFTVERKVTLDVTELVLEPSGGVTFAGPRGGPFLPPDATYTLHNTGLGEMAWTAEASVTWVDVSPAQGTILDSEGTAEIMIAPSPGAATLDPGNYTGTITVTSLFTGAATVRTVELVVGKEAFGLQMAQVPPSHVQPSGPTHRFRISKFEVTHDKFVQFLNDAEADAEAGAESTERSSFMAFDLEGGCVSLLSGEPMVVTQSGIAASRILYSAASVVGSRYSVEPGFERHPVTHVSWYGAVKFCNWLTVAQGMDPQQRAYHEGPQAEDWTPVASADQLIYQYGFRLPMDDEQDGASAFNEWHKAAAWQDSVQTEAKYGFGRDTLTGADANYAGSNDPFEPGTTPVGFFDGTVYNADGQVDEDQVPEEGDFTTAFNENPYSLFDLSGNVAEWVHGIGGQADERGVRGGHFENVESSVYLKTSIRSSQSAESVLPFVGFRVAQALSDPLGDIVVTQDLTRAKGPVGGPYALAGGANGLDVFTVTIHNPNDYTVDDLAVSIIPPNDRIGIVGIAPQQAPASSQIEMQLEIAATVDAPGVSPPPPSGDFVLVLGSDAGPEGPEYDYWISRTEVTNTQFAAFLNGALENLRGDTPGETSDYMYFDIESGSVYINDNESGEEGSSAPSDMLMYDASVGRIHLVNGVYTVDAGLEDHPVGGVSWYGAVKYCNWLTLSQGIPGPLRAYTEADSSNPSGWHPVVVDDITWVDGGLNDLARQYLVEDTLGYRLPMDHGADGASAYNEWYKAAAWDKVTTEESEERPYGFGRDALHDTDANYFASGDTEEDGTTPVRFFDGGHTLYVEPATCIEPQSDPVATTDTDNRYGLYDACGNVAEWTQDLGTDISTRATRGGSWRDPVDSPALTTTGRTLVSPETTADDLGFRVVRGTGHVVAVTVEDRFAETTHFGYFILDLREPLCLYPRTDQAYGWTYGDEFPGSGESYLLTNDSDSDMIWETSVDQPWVNATEEGTITAGGTMMIAVTTSSEGDTLGPGEHVATITFRNATTGQSETRKVILSIAPPIAVHADDDEPHEFQGFWGGPFDSPLSSRSFELESRVGFNLEYAVTWDQAWLTVEPLDPGDLLSGTLPAGAAISFAVSVNESADSLPVGEYEGNVRFAFTDPDNNDLTDAIEQPILLTITDPIVITQSQEPWRIDQDLDPENLPSQSYTLANNAAVSIDVSIGVDQDWIDIGDTLEIPSGQERSITANVNDHALTLFDGQYTTRLTFEDQDTSFEQCRTVVLTIEETLSVGPFDDYVTSGICGGSIWPPLKTYRLTNIARDQAGDIQWEASVQTPGVDWVLINGTSQASGVLSDGQSTIVIVSIDPAATSHLAQGAHTAVVELRDVTNDESITRAVHLSLVVPAFGMVESDISAAVEQPGGPDYSYKMAAFHTTNAEFVTFLNDAMVNLDNLRGFFLYFDTDSGNVFVNESQNGTVGVDGLGTVIFSPSANPYVSYDEANDYYEITAGYEDHPVTGVSWYGALKYCNWLTLDQGMLPSDRCYLESTDGDLYGWRPVTISQSDWEERDLNDTERRGLTRGCRGYRLPMDNGHNNTNPHIDLADPYNEWYKAAAWSESLEDNTEYGFGGETLTGEDANFYDSGDQYDNGTTPVGWYSANGFGLYDMTGNAYQWMQGRFDDRPGNPGYRTMRGGSWGDAVDADSLRANSRTFTPPHLTDSGIGFRVVRVPPTTPDVNQDGDVDLQDCAAMAACLAGPDAGLVTGCALFDVDADDDLDLADVAAFQNAFTGSMD